MKVNDILIQTSHTVECCYNAVKFITILHMALTLTVREHKSDFKLTTDIPYLALTGELWGVYYENFEENWLRYNGTALYFIHRGPIDNKSALVLVMLWHWTGTSRYFNGVQDLSNHMESFIYGGIQTFKCICLKEILFWFKFHQHLFPSVQLPRTRKSLHWFR